jgi:hypothetical protein
VGDVKTHGAEMSRARERPSAGTDTISGESLALSANDDDAGRQLDNPVTTTSEHPWYHRKGTIIPYDEDFIFMPYFTLTWACLLVLL